LCGILGRYLDCSSIMFSFALYGLKVVSVSPMVGLVAETLLITPVALVLVGYWTITRVGHLGAVYHPSVCWGRRDDLTAFALV